MLNISKTYTICALQTLPKHYLELNLDLTEVLCFPKSTGNSIHLFQVSQTGCSWCHDISDLGHFPQRLLNLTHDVYLQLCKVDFDSDRLVLVL